MKRPKEYEESPNVSRSELGLFRRNLTRFYNVIEMRNPLEQRPSASMKVGDIVDALLTNPAAMDDYYTDGVHCSDALQEIIDKTISSILYLRQHSPLAIENQQWEPLTLDGCKTEIIATARELDYNRKLTDDGLFKKIKDNASRYFELRTIYRDKIILSPDMYRTAKRCAERIEQDAITGPILNGFMFNNPKQHRVAFQLQVYTQYGRTPIKGLMDLTLFDDDAMMIYPFDIKTSESMIKFYGSYYDYGYPYQGSFYRYLLAQAYPGYRVAPFRFIVGPTETDEAPMVFTMSQGEDILYAQGGMDRRNHRVTGWQETIRDLEWHRSTGNWTYPRAYYYNNYELMMDSAAAGAVTDLAEDLF